MKATFKNEDSTVTVSVLKSRLLDGTMSSEVWGVVRPLVEPVRPFIEQFDEQFDEQFHCVRFTIDRDGGAEISIATESRNVEGVMASKMEKATVVAKQQIAYFEAMKLKMQGMAGDPEMILDAMRKGDYGNAGFMLIMCPEPYSQHLTPKAKQALPSDSKADSVITAVVLDPSFQHALAMMAFDESSLSDQDTAAYRFAYTARNIFAKPYRKAIQEEMEAFPAGERVLANFEYKKLVEYIG